MGVNWLLCSINLLLFWKHRAEWVMWPQSGAEIWCVCQTWVIYNLQFTRVYWTHCNSSLCRWLLPRKFPYWQEWMCSWICSRNHSLNSNACGDGYRWINAIKHILPKNTHYSVWIWRTGHTLTHLWKLLGQLPDTLQELSEDRRHLLWIPVQLVTPLSRQPNNSDVFIQL